MSNIAQKLEQEETHFVKISCSNLDAGSFSQTILQIARNLLEHCLCMKYINTFGTDDDFSFNFFHNNVLPKANSGLLGPECTKIARTHNAIDVFSHESMEEETSQTLLYHFYPELIFCRNYAYKELGIRIFEDLEKRMPPLDKQDEMFYETIASTLDSQKPLSWAADEANLYYVVKERPFFVNGKAYYELVLDKGFSRERRTDCFVAFSSSYLTTRYACYFTFEEHVAIFKGNNMPFKTVATVGIHIRGAEFRKLGIILKLSVPNSITKDHEYTKLINYLQSNFASLAHVVQFPDDQYVAWLRQAGLLGCESQNIKTILDRSRKIISVNGPGSNILLLLLHTMNNRLLRDQIQWTKNNDGSWTGKPNDKASDLCIKNASLPFDTLPYASCPARHPIPYELLYDIIDSGSREFEFLTHFVENQTDSNGILYIPDSSVPPYHKIDDEISKVNAVFQQTFQPSRQLVHYQNHIFVSGCETTTKQIIEELARYSRSSSPNYSAFIRQRYQNLPISSHHYSQEKINLAGALFPNSLVAFVKGAAGTGKTTFIGLATNLLASLNPLILAKTNAASDNLRDRIPEFSRSVTTIDSFLGNPNRYQTKFCVIDECSTISNDDMLNILRHFHNKPLFLLLVGDEHQIESIHIGNWFRLAQKLFPFCCHELKEIFRAKDRPELQKLWAACRKEPKAGDALTLLGHGNYTSPIDDFDFKKTSDDGVVLCLNYDGLYGINNINRIMQANNPGAKIRFRDSEFRVGDPVIFSESRRLLPYIHNGMHGLIKSIDKTGNLFAFQIVILSPMTIPIDPAGRNGFVFLGQDNAKHSIVQITVAEHWNQDEDTDDNSASFIPFEVSYAVSIHRAQGLEYSNVRIIVTDGVAEHITPNIFYTAITRTTKDLKIYWSPASALSITNRLSEFANKSEDLALFCSRFPGFLKKQSV
jgi:hypothetical protein